MKGYLEKGIQTPMKGASGDSSDAAIWLVWKVKRLPLQGHLADKKTPSPRTLQ